MERAALLTYATAGETEAGPEGTQGEVELGPRSLDSAAPLTLPEREEDNSLDGEKLEDGLKGLQELPGGEVEKEQGIESQADRDVVYEGDVEVAAVDAGIQAGARVRVGHTPPVPSPPRQLCQQ